MNIARMMAALEQMEHMSESEQKQYAEAAEVFGAIYALGYAAGAAKAEEEREVVTA